jgi:hypothetical protein
VAYSPPFLDGIVYYGWFGSIFRLIGVTHNLLFKFSG